MRTTRTDAELKALLDTRNAAEARAQNLADALAVLNAKRVSGERFGRDVPVILEAAAERAAYLAKLQSLSDAAEVAFEAADRAWHVIDHEESRCTCDMFAPARAARGSS